MGCAASVSDGAKGGDATATLQEPTKVKTDDAKPAPAVPATAEPAAEPALAEPAAPALPWWAAPLDESFVAVRREVRALPDEEQKRFGAAVIQLRENKDGVPGTSEYFRLAIVHGGMRELSSKEYPPYCCHGLECFPNWHRPYLLDFERSLRRADQFLGGDGRLALPYWDWSQAEANGEVVPKVIRDVCMREFDSDFFPVEAGDVSRNYGMAVNSDADIGWSLRGHGVAAQADACLLSKVHSKHATTKYSDPRNTSLESPHNSIHMAVGGMMGHMHSSFHPVFWVHHCNVDRIYEGYLKVEPDSQAEFRRHQKGLGGNVSRDHGFPEGPWGPYFPFKHPTTGEQFHARDTFDCRALGFAYDAVPAPNPPQLREMPYYAIFPQIDIKKLPGTCSLYVYVTDSSAEWTAPGFAATPRELMAPETGFAGSAGVFFLDTNACPNCLQREPYDEYVDITAALRANRIRPAKCKLRVLVIWHNGSGAQAIEATALHAPMLRGPKFESMETSIQAAEGKEEDDEDEDVAALKALLGDALAVDSMENVIKAAQKRLGLKEDGVAGPKTKRALLSSGLSADDALPGEKLDCLRGDVVTYKVLTATMPASLPRDKTLSAIQDALDVWTAATGVSFAPAAPAAVDADGDDIDDAAALAGVRLTISWEDRTAANDFVFDGPGGALAVATPSSVILDSSEFWELDDAPHPRRKLGGDAFFDPYFRLEPVLLHEIGHVLGLTHSDDSEDVMAPFYVSHRLELTEIDVQRAQAIFPQE